MKIVIPIAGRGSRFREAGYKEPKPLIEIRGKLMVRWATDSINEFIQPENLIFIVLRDHVDKFQIDMKLKNIYGDNITVISSDRVTEGAACTVLLAKEHINNDEELIIYNADQYFKCSLVEEIKTKPPEVKGLIPVFKATNIKWSYAKTDENDFVVKVAEKIPISTDATVGLYYFAHGKDFVWAAEEMIKKNLRVNNWFYICPVYQHLIDRGAKIKIIESKFVWGLGSPDEIKEFRENVEMGD